MKSALLTLFPVDENLFCYLIDSILWELRSRLLYDNGEAEEVLEPEQSYLLSYLLTYSMVQNII
jgi:hypothetical protein